MQLLQRCGGGTHLQTLPAWTTERTSCRSWLHSCSTMGPAPKLQRSGPNSVSASRNLCTCMGQRFWVSARYSQRADTLDVRAACKRWQRRV